MTRPRSDHKAIDHALCPSSLQQSRSSLHRCYVSSHCTDFAHPSHTLDICFIKALHEYIELSSNTKVASGRLWQVAITRLCVCYRNGLSTVFCYLYVIRNAMLCTDSRSTYNQQQRIHITKHCWRQHKYFMPLPCNIIKQCTSC